MVAASANSKHEANAAFRIKMIFSLLLFGLADRPDVLAVATVSSSPHHRYRLPH